jgi:hypothetical protein
MSGFTFGDVARLAATRHQSPRHARTADGFETPPRFWWRLPGEAEAAFRARVEAEACSTPILFY